MKTENYPLFQRIKSKLRKTTSDFAKADAPSRAFRRLDGLASRFDWLILFFTCSPALQLVYFTSFHYLFSMKAPGTAIVQLGLFAKRGRSFPYHFSSVVVP